MASRGKVRTALPWESPWRPVSLPGNGWGVSRTAERNHDFFNANAILLPFPPALPRKFAASCVEAAGHKGRDCLMKRTGIPRKGST